MDFRLHLSTQFNNGDFPEVEEITELRREHAEGLAKDKKFMFGKYVISENGKVCTLPFKRNCQWQPPSNLVKLGS